MPVHDGEFQHAAAAAIGVTARIRNTLTLDDVTLTVPRGTAVALLGPNGAGKTSLINLLTGLRRPQRGTVTLFGKTPRDWRTRRRLGVVPQEIGFLPFSRVGEVLDLVRAHHRTPLPRTELLKRFDLETFVARDVGRLSSGQRRRLAIALAFAGRPDLLIMDEPTSGLDLQSRGVVWQEVRRRVDEGGGVVLTTHTLEEVTALADHVVLLHRGRVLAAGTVAHVTASVETSRRAVSTGAAVQPRTLEEAVLRLIQEAP